MNTCLCVPCVKKKRKGMKYEGAIQMESVEGKIRSEKLMYNFLCFGLISEENFP